MISFTERQRLLVQLLGELEGAISGADLAALLGVSVRTVRYDVQRINRGARTELVVADNSGYRLARVAFRDYLAQASEVRAPISNAERILLYLTTHPVTDVYDVMRDCYVSETVARSELARISSELTGKGLSLSVTGARVQLAGSELALRKLIGQMVRQAMDTVVGRNQRIAVHFPDIDVTSVHGTVAKVLAKSRIEPNDIHLENAVITLAICLQRRNSPLTQGEYSPSRWSPSVDKITLEVLEALVDLYPDRPLAAVDRAYARDVLAVTLSGHLQIDEVPSEVDQQLENAVRQALTLTIEKFNLPIPADKQAKLFRGLSEHTARLVARNKLMPYFHNGLRESLKSRSPLIYDAAVYMADRLFRGLGLPLPDDEIGLLAIYLGLYSEATTFGDGKITAVLVCPRYGTLRDWLLSGLMHRFGERLRIVDMVATNREAIGCDADLVISTLGEQEMGPDTVRISALLSKEDLSCLENALTVAATRRSRRCMAQAMARFMNPSLYFADSDVTTSHEAIRFLCGQLYETGAVPEDFEESVRLREAYSSTAFARRFAVPHSMDFMAHQTSVCILIPRRPIPWGEAEASLVMLLAVNSADYDEFERFYQPLINLLMDPQRFAEVQKMKTFRDFSNYLVQKLSA